MSRLVIFLGVIAVAIAIIGTKLSVSYAGPTPTGNGDTGLVMPSIGL
jgi:hypothetical protein